MDWSKREAGSAFDLGEVLRNDLDSLLSNRSEVIESKGASATAAPYGAEAVGKLQSFIQIQRRVVVTPEAGSAFVARACWLTADAIVLVLPCAVAFQAMVSLAVPSPCDEGPVQVQARCLADWHILFRGGVRQCMRIQHADPQAKAALAWFVRTRQQSLRIQTRGIEAEGMRAPEAFGTLTRI